MIEEKITGAQVIEEAREWIGTPYIHQQRLKGRATDCVGLVIGIYEHFVGRVPRKIIPPYSPAWAEEGNHGIMVDLLDEYLVERSVTDRTPGLIATFSLQPGKPIKHAGILAPRKRIIHAYDRHPVHEGRLSPWWEERIRKVYALPNMED